MDQEIHLHLNKEDIKKYIRNREPLLLVEEAYDVCPGKYANGRKNIPEEEWFFECHFPGEPMVPGVLQLEAMFQTAALAIHTLPGNEKKKSYIARVQNVYFQQHVLPGLPMDIETEIKSYRRGIAKCLACIKINEEIVSKAEFRLIVEEDMILKSGDKNVDDV